MQRGALAESLDMTYFECMRFPAFSEIFGKTLELAQDQLLSTNRKCVKSRNQKELADFYVPVGNHRSVCSGRVFIPFMSSSFHTYL